MSETNSGHRVGQEAPDFTLPDGDGQPWILSAQRGKVVALLFYPGDETPVCTKQLCSVRNRWDEYADTGAEVVGISTDTSDSHKKFAGKYSLPLRLLSDVESHVVRLYQMRSIIPGQSARGVIVIDREGIIRYRQARTLIGLIIPPSDDGTLEAIRAIQSGNDS